MSNHRRVCLRCDKLLYCSLFVGQSRTCRKCSGLKPYWHESIRHYRKESDLPEEATREVLIEVPIHWYKALKTQLQCNECGESRIETLDFHHIKKEEKESSVSLMVSQRLEPMKIIREIAKCEVLCSNCHRVLHRKKHVTP